MYACFVEAARDRPGLVSDVDVDVDADVDLGWWWCVDGEIPEDGMGWHQDVKVCSAAVSRVRPIINQTQGGLGVLKLSRGGAHSSQG